MSFCILAASSCIYMCTLTVLSVIQCTTLVLQIETLQYCHLQYHFQLVHVRDTKFFAVHTMFRHCPTRKYLQNPAARWLQEMAPLWSRLVRQNADATQKCYNFAWERAADSGVVLIARFISSYFAFRYSCILL